jgi:hypothetical protein
MMVLSLVRLYALFNYALDYLISVQFQVNPPSSTNGYEWKLNYLDMAPTAKGRDMLDAVMTIAHNGMDFLAQISTLLPANAVHG